MNETVIFDLNSYPLSDRHGAYGGMAGSKDGLLIGGEYWMVKYPKSTKGMRPPVPSYTSSPLSEYIGSHVYGILGYDAHETRLGFRNNKIVVACKDFCRYPGDLREIRTLKNAYNKELEEKLNTSLSGTSSSHIIDLDEILIHLKHNPILSNVPGLTDRFWDCVIVDGLINNNDRNNGNWGLLSDNGILKLAPVFDNGASFSSKLPDERLLKTMSSEDRMLASSLKTTTAFGRGEHLFSFQELIEAGSQYPEFVCSLKRNVPLIRSKMNEIKSFIMNIPEEYYGISVCSQLRKEFYTQGMQLRLEHILVPALEKAQNIMPSLNSVIKACECKRESCLHKNNHPKPISHSER